MPAERLSMKKIRDVLRLTHGLGLSRRKVSEATGIGVRRGKAAFSSGCKPHPATAPAGSNRSSHGGNEVAEAFDNRVTR